MKWCRKAKRTNRRWAGGRGHGGGAVDDPPTSATASSPLSLLCRRKKSSTLLTPTEPSPTLARAQSSLASTTFPILDFNSAIALASTFTDVVLGTLQDVASLLVNDGGDCMVRGILSVVGQEGEQNGFYRSLLGKTPAPCPSLRPALASSPSLLSARTSSSYRLIP
jgi:hypothetical protein